MLICAVDERIRILRIMDLIQINMRYMYYSTFLLREYNGGLRFTITVNGEEYETEKIYTERGSYIVEAVIVVPVFIVAVLMLISIIPPRRFVKHRLFFSGRTQVGNVQIGVPEKPAALPANAAYRIRAENPKLRFYQIRGFRYLYREGGNRRSDSYGFSGGNKRGKYF